MVRKHQTRNLEIPDRRFASSGMTEWRRRQKEGPPKRAFERSFGQLIQKSNQAVLV